VRIDDEISRFYRSLPYSRYLQTRLWEITRAWAFYNAGYMDEFTGERPDLWEDLLLLQGDKWLPWYAQLDENYSADWLKGFETHHVSYDNMSWERRRELIVVRADVHRDIYEFPKFKGEVNNFALHKRSWLNEIDPDTGIPLGETRIPGSFRRKAYELDTVAVQVESQHRREIHAYIEGSRG
jgi:hypothetical protein